MNFLFLSEDFNQIDQVFMTKLLLTKEQMKNIVCAQHRPQHF